MVNTANCVLVRGTLRSEYVPIMETVGPFSIHRRIDTCAGFSVTHTATGYAVGHTASVAEGVRMAQELAVAADWGFTTPNAVKKWSRYRTDKVKRIVRKFAAEAQQK